MDLDLHHRFPRGLIQVAGVRDEAEARMLLAEDVDLLGLPLHLPVNEPDLDTSAAGRLSRKFPGRCCLITYLAEAGDLARAADELAVDWLQLHGEIEAPAIAALRAARPRLLLIKSLVIGREPIEVLLRKARKWAPHVEAFLTDTFDPESGAEGATGKCHDWEASRRLRASLHRPLLLAGGLGPDNVASALRAVRPAGADSHTGLEDASGAKDRAKVRRFVKEVRTHFS